MTVYRICSLNEILEIIKSQSFDNAGNTYFSDPLQNTFIYDVNKKYLHFYRNLQSVANLYNNYRNVLCIYNIPDELLKKSIGQGYYGDQISIEYAIDVNDLKIEYLKTAFIINDLSNISEINGSILYRRPEETKHLGR